MRRRKFNPRQKEKRPRINMQIRVPEVTLIDNLGKNLGPVKTNDAIRLANEKGLDLVEISPNTNPPVAKILDFGKYMYEKEKKEKGSKKISAQEMKTIRIGLYTGEHDLKFKAKQADKFLKKGHPVKIDIFLRGRERALRNIAREKINEFPNYISESYIAEEEVKSTPSGFNMILRPSKK